MVLGLGKLPVPECPTIWMIVGQGPIALAIGAGVGYLDILTLLYPLSSLSPSLWETARYRLKYCLKAQHNQPTSLDLKQEGHEALNRSPEYTGQSQTFNFEI